MDPFQAENGAGPGGASASRSGFHSFIVQGTQFVVDSHYQPLKPIGTGAYGVVCSALDRRYPNNKRVAIKKITKAYEDLIDAKRILREVKLLRHMSHENIVRLLDLIPPPGLQHHFEDIYMVLDFMETDLHRIIYSKNRLTDEHIQYFVYQILKALKYIHSANVIHRDLKPSNVLLNSNCELKLCDFGLARGVNDQQSYELTEYVVTRWYRAPEVMCACQEYDQKIDVWSLGCIMAELHGRKPLFAGDDYIHQMQLIFSVLGTPSEEDMAFITNPKALQYIRSQRRRTPINLQEKYPNANPEAVDLMVKMLAFNPQKRISVDEALAHPYLRSLRQPDSETMCPVPFDFKFEKVKMTKEAIQAFMMEEICKFRPGIRATWQPLHPLPQVPLSPPNSSHNDMDPAESLHNPSKQSAEPQPDSQAFPLVRGWSTGAIPDTGEHPAAMYAPYGAHARPVQQRDHYMAAAQAAAMMAQNGNSAAAAAAAAAALAAGASHVHMHPSQNDRRYHAHHAQQQLPHAHSMDAMHSMDYTHMPSGGGGQGFVHRHQIPQHNPQRQHPYPQYQQSHAPHVPAMSSVGPGASLLANSHAYLHAAAAGAASGSAMRAGIVAPPPGPHVQGPVLP